MQNNLDDLLKRFCIDFNKEASTKQYEIVQLFEADIAIGLKGQAVLEIGGSLPKDLVFKEFGVGSWYSLESTYWNELTNTKTLSRLPLNQINDLNLLPKHSLLDGLVEDLPDIMFECIDRIVSIAALEHVTHLPRAIDRMYKVLKPGGKLYAFIGPVWSAFNGHHLKEITDQAGKIFKFGKDGIPPWGHLLYSPPVMFEYLKTITDEYTADIITHEIYNTPAINRLFIEDYVKYFEDSKFNILECSGVGGKKPDKKTEKLLRNLNPLYNIFEFECLKIVLEKPQTTVQKNVKKKSQSPLVTIGLPVYNDSKYLASSIQSLVNQTYQNIEILICDDASNDSSFEIATKWTHKDTRIKLYQNDHNLGVTGNFNRIRSMANGHYVMLHSANDTIANTLVEKSVDYLENNPKCALVTAKVIRIDHEGLYHSLPPQEMYYQTMDQTTEEGFLTVVSCFCLGDYNYGMIRRSILRKVQPYRWCGGPDHVFIAEIALYGGISFLNEHLRRRRTLPEDSTSDRNHLSIRRIHHGRQSGIDLDDIFLKMKFLHMTYEHVQMLHESFIDNEKKHLLANDCVKILRQRFGQIMVTELKHIINYASSTLEKLTTSLSRGQLDVYERLEVEEINKALSMAQMVFPENRNVIEARKIILASLSLSE